MTDKPESFEEIVAEMRRELGPPDDRYYATVWAPRLEAERARSGRVNVAALRAIAAKLHSEHVLHNIKEQGSTRFEAMAAAIESALSSRFSDEEREAMRAGAFFLETSEEGDEKTCWAQAATLRRMLDEEGS